VHDVISFSFADAATSDEQIVENRLSNLWATSNGLAWIAVAVLYDQLMATSAARPLLEHDR